MDWKECGSDHGLILDTNKQTTWNWALLQRPPFVQPLKDSFYGTWRFITAFTRVLHWSLSWARSVQSIQPHPIIQILPWHSYEGIEKNHDTPRYELRTFQIHSRSATYLTMIFNLIRDSCSIWFFLCWVLCSIPTTLSSHYIFTLHCYSF
jgi:hypothetical protein